MSEKKPIPFSARVGRAFGSLIHGFKVGASGQTWEGHESSRRRQRPTKRLESQDSGLDGGIREEMLSEARALEQTFPIVGRINRAYANHCISSCRVKWTTGEPEIDKVYAAAWKVWMLMCDRSGRLTFPKMTKVAIERGINDGDIFGQMDDRGGFLQMAGIEADRVSSGGNYNKDQSNLIGGISIDANGRKISARIWERSVNGACFTTQQEIPFNQLVHVYDPQRFDAYRGVTHYHRVLNSIRTLKSTIDAESTAATLHSRLTLLAKVKAGGASAGFDPFGGTTADTDSNGNQITVKSLNDLAIAYMFPDEDLKAHTSDRPSEGWLKLMEWMVREIATGLHLPFGVVWHMAGLGSPAVRFEINQANRVFMAFLQDVVDPMWFRPIVGRWLSIEIKQGRLPFHPNWFRFKTPRPKSITIDLGRESKAGIEENRAGLGTASNWFIEEDEDFEEQTDQLVYEARFRECARLGVPFNPKLEIPLEQIRVISANPPPPSDTVPDPEQIANV